MNNGLTLYSSLPRFEDWWVERTPPGQWDNLSGRVIGAWESPMHAALAWDDIRIPLGLGFYTKQGTVKAAYEANGLVSVDFTAVGLVLEKYTRIEYGEAKNYQMENIKIPVTWRAGRGGGLAPSTITDYIGPRTGGGAGTGLQFMFKKADVNVPEGALDIFAADATPPDWQNVSVPIASHYLWGVTGGTPPGMQNPFDIPADSDFTAHYPAGWWMTIQPGQVVGKGSHKLYMRTHQFRFSHFVTPG